MGHQRIASSTAVPGPPQSNALGAMEPTVRKIVAREWLFFLVWIIGALILVPLICGAIWPSWPGLLTWEVYKALVFSLSIDNVAVAWALILGPYGIFQLMRSINWAIRTLLSP